MTQKNHQAHIIPILLLFLCTAFPDMAHTDVPIIKKSGHYGADLRLFRSSVDTKGHFSVDGSGVLPANKFSLSLMLDFGFHGWIAPDVKTVRAYRNTVIDTFIYSVLMFNYGLKDMIVVGAGIPIALPSGTIYDGTSPGGDDQTASFSTRGGFGDLTVHAKLRWIRADRHPVGLSTLFQYQIPTGDAEYLMGAPKGGAFRARLIADVEPRSFYRAALNIGVHLPLGAMSGVDNRTRNVFAISENPADRILFQNGPQLEAGLGHSISIWPRVMDLVMELYGTHQMTRFDDPAYLSAEASGGFKLYIDELSYLLAGYAHGIPTGKSRSTNPGYGVRAMEQRLFLGFAYEPSIGDMDRDGIKDDVDQCPRQPEDMDRFLDSDGCPEPDNDMDGIPDNRDDCPMIPEDADGSLDEDGCPERDEGDRDGDGILDRDDKCPDTPEDLDGFEDENGCPDQDNDKDLILDVNDQCPNVPEDNDGFEDENGCPDQDNDKDRILDVNDHCPNNPEVYNGKQDSDGCPDQGDVILQGDTIRILKKVYFEYDSANIKKVSFDILDAVAQTIINNPQIELVEVGGHADQNGTDQYNLKLTADRAASVERYLVAKGVPPQKLVSTGYGEYCPVDEGQNEAAYEKNRRVEFKVLRTGGIVTGATRGCARSKKAGVVPATP